MYMVISMGLEALSSAAKALSSIFSGATLQGIGTALVLVGIGILLVIGVGFGIYVLVRLIRELPNMTISQFLKVVVLSAIALIVIGIILP